MTDETREQIRRDAEIYMKSVSANDEEDRGTGYYMGAMRQHPIAYEAGRKAGIEEAMDHIGGKMNDFYVEDEFFVAQVLTQLKKELEALKTKV